MSDQTKVVLCFGDSNTWGYDPATQKRFPRDVRWPGVLRRELGEGFEVIEEGLCGRTTVWEDPIEQYKSGGEQLVPAMLSHSPLDLLVIMLGTNDLKSRFSVSALEVAQGAGNLVRLARGCETGYSGPAPDVLLLCPPPFASMEGTPFVEIFAGAEARSKELATYFRQIAEELDCHYLDTSGVITSSPLDGIHLESSEHAKLGSAVAVKVREILAK